MRVADKLKRTMVDASLLARVGAEPIRAGCPRAGGRMRVGAIRREKAAHCSKTLSASAERFSVSHCQIWHCNASGEDGADAESLFKHAEVALKLAKSSGERLATIPAK
jgi:GGDEF domain-containing protein